MAWDGIVERSTKERQPLSGLMLSGTRAQVHQREAVRRCLCDWLLQKQTRREAHSPHVFIFCSKRMSSHPETLGRFPGLRWPFASVRGYFLVNTMVSRSTE